MRPVIKILYVEDNDFDSYLFSVRLSDYTEASFEVEVAETLYQAEEILMRDSKFDLILLDLNLPDSRGLETLESMQKTVDGVIPIIATSGIGDAPMLEAAKEIGAIGFSIKSSSDKNFVKNLLDTLNESKSNKATQAQ